MAGFALPSEEQSILLVGKNGSGKTRAAVWHLSRRDLENERWLIINHKREPLINSLPGAHFLELDEFPAPNDTGLYIYEPRPEIDDAAVTAILWRAYQEGRIGVYLDEGYMVSPRDAALNSLYTQGRSKKIPIITLSQRPTRISRFAVSEAMFFQIFLLTDRRDRKTIAEFVPLDLDGYMTARDGAPRALAPYHSIYYDTREDAPVMLAPVPDDAKIVADIAAMTAPPEPDYFEDAPPLSKIKRL